MSQRQKRYLLFADILGTRGLYKARNSLLLEKRRTSLGHALRTAVYPYIDNANVNRMRINLFSDTALVASPNLGVLMEAAAKLFYVFSLRTSQATIPDEFFLLRGGIAYGEVLTSHSLASGNHVDVADIFDTSLAMAFELETLRKGSRIFLCEDTHAEATKTMINCCHKWHSVTGIGSPVSPAFEFLWPTALFEPEGRFGEYFDMLCTVWYRLFTAKKDWEIPEYDTALYQLDETIKLCIRSAARAPRRQARATWDRLVSYLPTERRELAALDVRFTWGTWFQILWALLLLKEQHPFLPTQASLRDLIGRNLRIVADLDYIATFQHELENRDYAWFRKKTRGIKTVVAPCATAS
jgi:hypothetical protein